MGSILGMRWEKIWLEMSSRGVEAVVVRGARALGQYGYYHFVTGVFPEMKRSYAVLPLGEKPVVVCETRLRAEVLAEDEECFCRSVFVGSSDGLLWDALAVAARVGRGGSRVAVTGSRNLGFTHDEGKVLAAYGVDWLGDNDVGGEVIRSAKAAMETEEVQLIAAAGKVADAGMLIAAGELSPGKSERAVAAVIEGVVRREGACLAEVHVSVGRYCGQAPTGRVLGEGSLITVFVEVGVRQGYWVELGRVFAMAGADEGLRAWCAVLERLILTPPESLRVGGAFRDIAREAEEVIRGNGGCPVVGMGHMVGVDDDGPRIEAASEHVLGRGLSCVAFHPSVEWGGACAAVGDTYLVDESGWARVSSLPARMGC